MHSIVASMRSGRVAAPARSAMCEHRAGATRGDENRACFGHLVHRGGAQLSCRLEHEVEAVDIALADQSTVRVRGQRASNRLIAVGDEVLGLAEVAEPKRLE